MSEKPRTRNASRPESSEASSSAVDSRTVAKRHCSAIVSEPGTQTPKWVWVLPTSTTSSLPCALCSAIGAGLYGERRSGDADLLTASQRGERASEPLAAGQRQIRVELEQRHEHEPAAGDLLVREPEPLRFVLAVVQQQDVDVDHARAVAGAAGGPADLSLDRLAGVEQFQRSVSGLDLEAGVEELRLIEDQADRLGVVGGGGAQDTHPMSRKRVHRRLQVRTPVTEVRSDAEKPPAHASRHTSTETSPTVRAIGGSGLAALTQTACTS